MSASPRRGFSIRIFLPDGTPDGLRTVEKSNWIGRGIICPRSQFREAKSRPEFKKTGVYVLRGPSESSDLPSVYIGEGDPALPRLEQHFAKKDFWTSLILFTSKDDNLNKAHVQYLESRLIVLGKDAKRCVLDNANTPELPSLSEPDMAEMEGFLEEMLLIYPVLGVTAFEQPKTDQTSKRILYLRGRGIEAKGYDAADGFVVLVGSSASKDTVPSIPNYLLELRNSLIERGILVASTDGLKLSQDYTFDSPSTAAGILLGGSYNGRDVWKDEMGRSLKQIQVSDIGEMAS
ncbi:MAG TPA: GIY-YIG nuclease family protein [Gemmataceae bacterium]|jgi:hypothetical protein